MQTNLPLEYLQTSEGKEADEILRSCVHCGFCTATCPTFLLTGNELDSPRGRIYLVKEMLEGGPVSKTTQTHLDRCLTCQSCETTCPSNVKYHRLLDIGRAHIDTKIGRSLVMSAKRFFIRKFFSNADYFKQALSLGRFFRPILPKQVKQLIPNKVVPIKAEVVALRSKKPLHEGASRRMILLEGCVQQGLSPQTNTACTKVLEKLGITSVKVEKEGCCGALSYHLNAQDEGLAHARNNIDLFCDQLDQGIEAIISTGSGCGNFIKEYSTLLKDDNEYQAKALRVSEACKDISEILAAENLNLLTLKTHPKLAFHCPCSLQHGQQLNGVVEDILSRLGFNLTTVSDSHLCCGSAGTYSILQPRLSKKLLNNKITALEQGKPDLIVTANVGCQSHLGTASSKVVKHWIETVDEGLAP